jgi:hypothetical protein
MMTIERGTNLSILLVGRGVVHHSKIGWPKSPSGRSRPGQASSESAHACSAAESGNKSGVFVAIAGGAP